MAGEGYAVVQPYVQKAVDGTKDTLGPIFGPTLGPYWNAFSTHVANSYAESHKLARGKYFSTTFILWTLQKTNRKLEYSYKVQDSTS